MLVDVAYMLSLVPNIFGSLSLPGHSGFLAWLSSAFFRIMADGDSSQDDEGVELLVLCEEIHGLQLIKFWKIDLG